MTAPGQVEQVRRRNVALVLGVLRTDGPVTRTELARRTGLAKATVGSIVTDLESAGLAAETGELTGGRGRPGRSVGLTGADVIGLGLEVNVDFVSTVSLDVSVAVRHSETVPVGAQSPRDVLVTVARRRLDELRANGRRICGITVAVPGLVGADRRTVRWAPNLDWHDVDLGADLDAATDLTGTTIDNDANCAAIGEASHGAATGTSSALYVTGTVGIGAGWVVDGALVRGSAGFAGEVGHLPLGDPGAECGCGRHGCWEASVGLRSLVSGVGVDATGTPWQTAEAVARRAADDPAVADHLAGIGERLGHGIAALSGVVDPEVVVLGGYFVPVAEWLVPAAESTIDDRLIFADLHRPELRLSPLGLQSAALGAAEESLTGILTGGIT